MKKCSCCKLEQDTFLFGKNKSAKDGLQNVCKSCSKGYRKPDAEYQKAYRDKNQEQIKKVAKQYYNKNKEYLKNQAKEFRENNKDSINEYAKRYRIENREELKLWHLENYHKIKEDKSIKTKLYHQTEGFKKKRAIYNQKRNLNPFYKLKLTLRNRILIALKRENISKNSSTMQILGCDFHTVKKHIQRQFKKGMVWSNHGQYGWHVDHIIPLSSAKNEDELIKLCHYTNLQPLWWRDNLIKNSKIIPTQIILAI